MYKLYYYPNNASLAPHFLLYEMQLQYELILVDRNSNAQKSEEYLKLNPAGRIPTLIDNGQAIFESPAICIHLCEQHPEKGLIPKLGTKERPIFFQWLTYLTNTLQAELMVRYYPQRHTNNESVIESIIEAQDKLITDSLNIINVALAGRKYLLGEKISACDFFLFMLAEWSLIVKPDLQTHTHLLSYLQRLALNPTICEVCKIEKIDLTPFAKK